MHHQRPSPCPLRNNTDRHEKIDQGDVSPSEKLGLFSSSTRKQKGDISCSREILMKTFILLESHKAMKCSSD